MYFLPQFQAYIFPPLTINSITLISESFNFYETKYYPVGDTELTGGFGFDRYWNISIGFVTTLASESFNEYGVAYYTIYNTSFTGGMGLLNYWFFTGSFITTVASESFAPYVTGTYTAGSQTLSASATWPGGDSWQFSTNSFWTIK